MADRFWVGTGASTDPENTVNWSTSSGGPGGVDVPGASDHVRCDSNGLGDMTLTTNWVVGNFTTLVGYTGDIDLVTHDLTISSNGDITLNHAGLFDCGAGTITVINGDFDNATVGSWNWTAGSTVVMGGTGNLVTSASRQFYNFTVDTGATISVATSVWCHQDGQHIINGTLILVGSGTLVLSSGYITVGPVGKITGDGHFRLYNSSGWVGRGIISLSSTAVIDVAIFEIDRPLATTLLPPGVYNSALIDIYNAGGSFVKTLQLSSGDYTFGGDIRYRTIAGGEIVMDNSVHNPNITLKGDIIWSAGGTNTYTKGTTGTMTLSGSANQNIELGANPSENLFINKPDSGSITLVDVDLSLGTCPRLAGDLVVSAGTGASDIDTLTGSVLNIDGDALFVNRNLDMGDGTLWNICGAFGHGGLTGSYDAGTAVINSVCAAPGTDSATLYIQQGVSIIASNANTTLFIDGLGFTNRMGYLFIEGTDTRVNSFASLFAKVDNGTATFGRTLFIPTQTEIVVSKGRTLWINGNYASSNITAPLFVQNDASTGTMSLYIGTPDGWNNSVPTGRGAPLFINRPDESVAMSLFLKAFDTGANTFASLHTISFLTSSKSMTLAMPNITSIPVNTYAPLTIEGMEPSIKSMDLYVLGHGVFPGSASLFIKQETGLGPNSFASLFVRGVDGIPTKSMTLTIPNVIDNSPLLSIPLYVLGW